MYSRIFTVVLLFFSLTLFSQNDFSKKELFDLLNKHPADTLRIDCYNELAWPVYSYDKPDSSIYFGEKAIQLATQIKDLRRLSVAHRRIGITFLNTGELQKSIAHEEESYALSEKLGFKRGMLLASNNIGVAYLNSELFNKALGYFLKGLKIAEETGDFSSATNIYTNCGVIYRSIGDFTKSKEFFVKADHYAVLKKNNDLLITTKCNLSTAYRNLKMIDSATFYLEEAGKHLIPTTSTASKFNYYLNRGLLFSVSNQHQKALEAFLACEPFIGVVGEKITLQINVAEEYMKLNEREKAFDYFNRAYELSKKNQMYSNLEYLSYAIATIYETKQDLKNYTRMLKAHLVYKDSNAQINKVQLLAKQQLEFDYERKYIADSVKFQQKDQLKNAELAVAALKLTRQKSFELMLLVILVIILVFSLFISNRFLLIRKQKKIIENQKNLVDVKNQEILDSINYAKRLQTAILPQIKDIKAMLDFDILYLPKDIIGGDFYFFHTSGDEVFIAICDCTGHGIPGAIMSVVCHQALQKSITEFAFTSPEKILSQARQLIIENLNARHQNIKDGMDCSLLVINKRTRRVCWAGANNPMWIILPDKTLVEIKPDKQPVAFYENNKEFTAKELVVEPGSHLYLFTDGYADQFGGITGKKYKNKPLKSFLLSICDLPVEAQVEHLHRNFLKWKNNLDQVDDVTIGVLRF